MISCAIDFFAGFLAGIDSFDPIKSGEKYMDFVRRYLPDYDPADVYKGVRCRLAHNFSIGSDLALTHNNAASHDPKALHGNGRVINFENFFEDFQKGVKRYFQELEGNGDLEAKFMRRVALGLVAEVPLAAK